MKTQRIGIHLISVCLLLLWGGVMLYFYGSGRLQYYLPPTGIFRPLVLISGIGMVILGLFNLATMGSKEAACCADDHGDGHDHDHDHGDGHKHGPGCGHDHGDERGHSHAHEHKHDHEGHECCGHDHDHGDHGHHHHHAAAAVALQHDHAHGHKHDHGHEHSHSHAGHAHGILDESGFFGRTVAILILAVPVTYAAVKTPDRYSANAVVNKGVYSTEYGVGARAERYSLKNKGQGTTQSQSQAEVAAVSSSGMQSPTPAPSTSPATTPPPATVAKVDPSTSAPMTPSVQDTPPAETAKATTSADMPPQGTPPVVTADKVPPPKGQDTKSYGSFTLKDLEAQVPKSPEGNFMLEVPEIFYTAGDKEVQSVITGQPVETIAQVLPEKGEHNPNGTRVRIFRLQVQCCAADARPYSIPVDFGKAPPSFKDMSWVKVVGKMNYHKEGDQVVPVIEAVSMTPAAEPQDTMVY